MPIHRTKCFDQTILLCLLLVVLSIPGLVQAQTIALGISGPDNGCAPVTLCFVNNSTGPFTGFEWDFNNDGIIDSTCGPENAGQTICHTFYGKTVGNRIRLYGKKADGTTPDASQQIFIYEPNTASIGVLPALVCSGMVDLTNTSTINDDGSAHSTTWDFGDGSPTVTTNDLSTSHEFVAEGNLTITMTDHNSCGDNVATANIRVNLLNTAINSSVGSQACQGETVSFSNDDHGPGLNYVWDWGDGTAQATTPNPRHRFLANGNYTVNLQVTIPDGQGCNDADSLAMTIDPGPIAGFATSMVQTCDSLTANFQDNTTDTLINDIYFWDFGNGDTTSDKNFALPVFYDSAGYYYPTLTVTRNSNNCSSSFIDTLLVPPTPAAAFGADNVCLGKTAQFTDLSTVAITPITSWEWDFGGVSNSILQNPSAVFNTPGQLYTSLVVSTNYCSDTLTKPIVIEDLPHPAFVPSVKKGCSPLEVIFANNTPDAVSFQWDFGDTQSDTSVSPTHQFVNNTLNNIQYTTKLVARTAFGCMDSISTTLKVFAAPTAIFASNASELPACVPDTVTFTSQTVGGSSLVWDFGDGTSGSSSVETHVFENLDYFFKHFQVTLVATSDSGCLDTSLVQYVSLYPKPRTDFVMDTSNNCHPASINFFAPVEANATYDWDFGNGNTLSTQSFTTKQSFANQGKQDTTYTIRLVATNQFNCVGYSDTVLTIHPKPNASFTVSPNPSDYGESINFTNLTGEYANWKYIWNFENAQTDSIVAYDPSPIVFETYDDVPVELIVTSNYQCLDTALDTLDIIPPPPNLDFVVDTSQGCPPLKVVFTDSSQFTDTSTYTWDFGDGTFSTAVNPAHTYYEDGVMSVTLTAKGVDNSNVSRNRTITVFEKPFSAFSVLPELVYVPDDPVYCAPTYPEDGEKYFWDFGDGDTSQTMKPKHFYEDTGQFEITLIVVSKDGCEDTLSQTLLAKTAGKVVAPNVFFPGGGGGGGGGAGGSGAGGGGTDPGGLVSEGDLGNAVFAPLTEGLVEYRLEIYNRWGELLFASDTKQIGWTGYYLGELCKEDVYVWKVRGKYSNGQDFVKAGTITLLLK